MDKFSLPSSTWFICLLSLISYKSYLVWKYVWEVYVSIILLFTYYLNSDIPSIKIQNVFLGRDSVHYILKWYHILLFQVYISVSN